MAEDPTYTARPDRTTVAETIPPPASPPGYELLDEIGRGGMGVVYRARDTALDRDVAVKLLSDRYAADSPAAQRFLREARITGQLQHPGIPAVHQVGTLADGRPFLAMKLIKGSTLEALLKHRPDPAADRGRLLAIFEAVCQALGYAHAHRVIHRDVKPANVMVGAFGEVQVMDWGLAKVVQKDEGGRVKDEQGLAETMAPSSFILHPSSLEATQAGSLIGTPAFISPEQAMGEIDKVDERADVFGLGAMLAVIFTGQPPYVGETLESVRVQAGRGKLEDCFARLDAAAADPELVALCKQCLAFEPADRPADGGAVAQAVAGLRAAADERARRAELERVRVEGEQATAQARAVERRKRRRIVVGAAAALAVAAVGGLTGVLEVQRQANLQLGAKNAELAEQQLEVEARFATAQKAIATFHTGVSEDFLLKNPEFTALRTKLLQEAAGFYADLEKLLAGKTDTNSRKLLAEGYGQLAELTAKIGDQKEALAVQRKALAVRRELAAAPGSDVETRLDVARSLRAVAILLGDSGDMPGTRLAHEEQRDLAAAMEAEAPTDAVRTQLAYGHNGAGWVLARTGKPAEALVEYQRALAVRQKLADANPAVTEFQKDVANSHYNIGNVLDELGRPAEGLQEYQKALAIRQKLAVANPADTALQFNLGYSHNNIGFVLLRSGKPSEALKEFQQALAIKQNLVDANTAVTEFQLSLSRGHYNIGNVLSQTGKQAEALQEYQKALVIQQQLAGANPTVTAIQSELATSHDDIGWVLSETGKLAEALKEFQKALALRLKLVDVDPRNPDYQSDLAWSHNHIGRLHAREKRFPEAFAALNRGLAIHQKLAEEDPAILKYTNSQGYSYAYRGWAHVRASHPAEAAVDLRRALALWENGKASGVQDRFERSRALALLTGLATDGKSGVTTAEAAAFADQAVAALRDAAQAGWGQNDELQEPDFDPLRGREDFKKLLAEPKARSEPKTKAKD
jgi:tetratricopeptide (TPR) repeat protein